MVLTADNIVVDWTKMFKKYKGMWVALKDDEQTVIVADKNPKIVKEKAFKKGFEHPILVKVPSEFVAYIG